MRTAAVPPARQCTSHSARQGFTRGAIAAVGTFGLLLASARTSMSQVPAEPPGRWEFRIPVGGLVPTGGSAGVSRTPT
jgi:hypothetical protein